MNKNSFGMWELPHLTKKEMINFFSQAFLMLAKKKTEEKKEKEPNKQDTLNMCLVLF